MGNHCFNSSNIYSSLCWVLLFSGYPVVFSYALGISYMLPLLAGVLILTASYLSRPYLKSIVTLNRLFYANILFWSFLIVYHNDFSYISNIFQVVVIYIFYLTVYNKVGELKFATQYINVIKIISLIGAVSMVLVFLFNIPPIITYSAHDGRPAVLFPFTATNVYYASSHPIIRFSGIFDEPGALAFFSMYALLLNRCIFNNIKTEKILIIAPLFTFSVAHILTVAFYCLLFKVKKISSFIQIALCCVFIVLLLRSLKGSELDSIYKLTIYRFEQNDSGDFQGDNRSQCAYNALEYFKSKPIIGFGKSFFNDRISEVGFNIFFIGAMFGIIGYMCIYSILWWGIWSSLRYYVRTHDSLFLKCYAVILLNLLQRPMISNILEVSSLLILVLTINNMIKYRNNILCKL